MQASRCRDDDDVNDGEAEGAPAAAAAADCAPSATNAGGKSPKRPPSTGSLSIDGVGVGPAGEGSDKEASQSPTKGLGLQRAASFRDAEKGPEHALDVAASAAILAAQNVRKRSASEHDLQECEEATLKPEPAAASPAPAEPAALPAPGVPDASAAAEALSQTSTLEPTDSATAKRRRI